MKTAVYVRVSSENQSCEAQLRAISVFLQSKGITDYQVYQDEGITGSTPNRPQLKALLNDCKLGKVELLVVWKLDRLFRSLSHLIKTLAELEAFKVKFVSVQENIDLSTAAGTLVMHLMGAIAQFERSLGVDRTKAGLANAKAKGIKLGRPTTLGAHTISQIKDLRNSGCTWPKIASMLDVNENTARSALKSNSKGDMK